MAARLKQISSINITMHIGGMTVSQRENGPFCIDAMRRDLYALI